MTTEPFTASNGDTVETRHDGCLVVRDGHDTEWVDPLTAGTLREYFTHERDTELGRWRDPEAPDMVVHRVPENDDKDGRAVRVIDEATGAYASMWERDVRRFGCGSMHATAAHYFAAHPERKPWHDAAHEEVWEITANGDTGPALATTSNKHGQALAFQFANGTLIEADSDAITAGRRIWPEETCDE